MLAEERDDEIGQDFLLPLVTPSTNYTINDLSRPRLPRLAPPSTLGVLARKQPPSMDRPANASYSTSISDGMGGRMRVIKSTKIKDQVYLL